MITTMLALWAWAIWTPGLLFSRNKMIINVMKHLPTSGSRWIQLDGKNGFEWLESFETQKTLLYRQYTPCFAQMQTSLFPTSVFLPPVSSHVTRFCLSQLWTFFLTIDLNLNATGVLKESLSNRTKVETSKGSKSGWNILVEERLG